MTRLPFFIFIIYIFFVETSSAQKDSLGFYYNSFGIPKYQINYKPVSSKAFNLKLGLNESALKKFNAGKKINLTSTIMQGAGGFLLGYNLADIMINKNKNYTAGAIGLGLIVVSLPISNYGIKKSNQALAMYHADEISAIKSTPEIHDISAADKWKNACLIVRIPVFGPKIKYLKSVLSNPETSQSSRSTAQKLLHTTIDENKKYFDLVRKGFDKEFSAKEVYFLPDSLFKSYMAGEKTGFLNKNGELDTSLDCYSDNTFFIITGKDIDQLSFVDRDLNPAGFPFPFRKNMFLGAFKKLLDKEKYMHKQISYFNEKLLLIKK
jgi:hypothetical protein